MGVFSSLSPKDAPDRVERNFWSWDKRKKREKKWMNTQSGRSTKPISPGGGREGTKRSRRFGPSIITPSPRKTAHSYASGVNNLFGAKTDGKATSCRGRDLRASSLLLGKGGGKGKHCPDASKGLVLPLKSYHPPSLQANSAPIYR